MKFKLATGITIFITGILFLASAKATTPGNNGETADSRGIFSSSEMVNLIQNPSFDEGTRRWTLGKFNGGVGRFSTDTTDAALDGKSARITTSNNIEGGFGDVQLLQTLSLKRNAVYNIHFSASVLSACLVSVSFSNGLDILFQEELLLVPGTRNYGPFSYKSISDEPFAIFSIGLGKTKSRLVFDNISVFEDNHENNFNDILAKTGINIHRIDNQNELFILLPVMPLDDLPVIFTDRKGKTLRTTKITKGTQEASFILNKYFGPGEYQVKVITPEKIMAYPFEVF